MSAKLWQDGGDGRLSGGQSVESHLDPNQIAFVCPPEGAVEPIMVAAKGLTKVYLMGEWANSLALPASQLALPFTAEAARQAELVSCMTGTTS